MNIASRGHAWIRNCHASPGANNVIDRPTILRCIVPMPDAAGLPSASPRLTSLDAFRGFVMFLMAAELLHVPEVADKLWPWPDLKPFPHLWIWPWNWPDTTPGEWPSSWIWRMLKFNSDHVQWMGLSLHDLIQPAFSFMVGVALSYSIASRINRGQSPLMMTTHAIWRALVLVLLGVFLRSIGKPMTYWTFEDTLSQIGLGYPFLFVLGFMGNQFRAVALTAILAGYWLFFVLYTPSPDFNPAAANVPAGWPFDFTGFAAHWNINHNAAWNFDRWFLNLFPHQTPFVGNHGGYSTLSFIPTLGTMILGLIAGQWMREGDAGVMPNHRGVLGRLFISGAICLALGWLMDVSGICPSVKKIWTPSWVLISGGWCFLLMALFYLFTDALRWRTWAFPFVVIGMNSIAIYVMVHTMKDFVRSALLTHVGQARFEKLAGYLNPDLTVFYPMILGAAILLVLWLILLWMYRRRIFLRI
jgi:heparan-alpha-glucosaminide N-acetyltransferase